jgi:hypothetical protein
MPYRLARKASSWVFLAWALAVFLAAPIRSSAEPSQVLTDFSGTLVKHVNGKRVQAQVFGKADRVRLEYKYALRTEYGYSAIEILRFDRSETWYLLPQQKEFLVTPLDHQEVLPIQAELAGERTRVVVGDSMCAGRAARLFELETERHGGNERLYQWVDLESGIVLKLVSRDRDWSVAYERFRLSPQPDYYFDAPPGYTRRTGSAGRR